MPTYATVVRYAIPFCLGLIGLSPKLAAQDADVPARYGAYESVMQQYFGVETWTERFGFGLGSVDSVFEIRRDDDGGRFASAYFDRRDDSTGVEIQESGGFPTRSAAYRFTIANQAPANGTERISIQYTFDPNGNGQTMRKAAEATRTFEAGRLVTSFLPQGVWRASTFSTFTYDNNGQVATRTVERRDSTSAKVTISETVFHYSSTNSLDSLSTIVVSYNAAGEIERTSSKSTRIDRSVPGQRTYASNPISPLVFEHSFVGDGNGEVERFQLYQNLSPTHRPLLLSFDRIDAEATPRYRLYRASINEEMRWYYADAISGLGQELPALHAKLQFPNPIQAGAQLQASELPQGCQLAIVDALGRKVYQLAAQSAQLTISWPPLPPGAYFVELVAPGFRPQGWQVVAR